MRISSMQAFKLGINSIKDISAQNLKTQDQISKGSKVLTPADDPVAAARIFQLEQDASIREQYSQNIERVEGRLNLEEGQLSSIGDTIIRIRELAIQAGNPTYNESNRASLANELEVRLDELVSLMNSRDANGEYIFSGYKGTTKPFVADESGRYVYQGDSGQRSVAIASSTNIPVSDSGEYLFMDIRSADNNFYTYANPNNTANPAARITQGQIIDQEAYDEVYPEDFIITFNDPGNVAPPGPNYTISQKSDGRVLVQDEPMLAGQAIELNGIQININGQPNQGDSFLIESTQTQDLITTVGRLINGLNTFSDTQGTELQALLDSSINNLDNAQERLLEGQSQVGGRLNTLDSTRDLMSQLEITSQEILSELRDLDYAEAVSQLSFETFVLQAAQQSYLKVANLSLFNFLR